MVKQTSQDVRTRLQCRQPYVEATDDQVKSSFHTRPSAHSSQSRKSKNGRSKPKLVQCGATNFINAVKMVLIHRETPRRGVVIDVSVGCDANLRHYKNRGTGFLHLIRQHYNLWDKRLDCVKGLPFSVAFDLPEKPCTSIVAMYTLNSTNNTATLMKWAASCLLPQGRLICIVADSDMIRAKLRTASRNKIFSVYPQPHSTLDHGSTYSFTIAKKTYKEYMIDAHVILKEAIDAGLSLKFSGSMRDYMARIEEQRLTSFAYSLNAPLDKMSREEIELADIYRIINFERKKIP